MSQLEREAPEQAVHLKQAIHLRLATDPDAPHYATDDQLLNEDWLPEP